MPNCRNCQNYRGQHQQCERGYIPMRGGCILFHEDYKVHFNKNAGTEWESVPESICGQPCAEEITNNKTEITCKKCMKKLVSMGWDNR